MILYKAKIGGGEIKFHEIEVLDETDHFFITNLLIRCKKFKKVSKTAKRPFASTTKKQAVEVLLHELKAIQEKVKFKPGFTFRPQKFILEAEKLLLTLSE